MVTGKKRITYGKVFLYLFTSLIAACCFLPILLIVIVSFTSEQAIVHNGYSFFPSELSLVAYNTLFENGAEVVRCYINSVFVTILGTILAVCITAMASYALVTPTVKYSNAIAMFFLLWNRPSWMELMTVKWHSAFTSRFVNQFWRPWVCFMALLIGMIGGILLC